MNVQKKEELFREYLMPLEEEIGRYIWRRVRDPQDTAEIRQNTYMYAWKGIDKLRDVNSAKYWMYRIARNCINEYWRTKMTKDRRIYLEPYEAEAIELDNIADKEEPIMNEIINDFKNSLAYEALHRLSEEERNLMTMRYIDNMFFKDISEMTGINEKTLSYRMVRIVKKYREIYFALEERDR